MKTFVYMLLLGLCLYSCSSTKNKSMDTDTKLYQKDTLDTEAQEVSDTVRIANDSLEYEIIIIDPGFSYFLNAVAQPEGYHSLSYLENKNQFLVNDYNQRVRQPFRYDSGIYTQEINYDPNIDYGYEVNYKLYNYFVYLSWKYDQKFSVPTRI